MGKPCEVDDNVSSSDQASHNLVSSVSIRSDNKTGKQNSRDANVSTVSSERAHSANNTFIRSDVSSEIRQTSNEKRENPSAVTAEEFSQGDSTTMVLHPSKQLKADSSLSKNSATLAQLSSVDSLDLKPTHSSSNNHGYSHPTQSVESKKIVQEFDLNEGMEANEANWHHNESRGLNFSGNDVLSGPIPVVAKVGVPPGLPKKPLQFGGELGWKRSGIPSAFHPTPHKNSEIDKVSVSRGFDLNITATDPEFPDDESSAYVSSKMPERFERGYESCQRPSILSIDLNHNPVIEEPCKSVYPHGQTRQLLQNFDTFGSVIPNITYPRPPYWVDLTSVRGYGHVQGQPFLLGAPTTEQVQMLVPVQLPPTHPGLYIGKVNNLTPTFYPPMQHMPGPAVLATYPGNIQLLENSHAFANMRQTILSNSSRAGHPAENVMSVRNHLFEERLKSGEQVAFPTPSLKRQEPDAGWGSSQINSRQMNSWN
ncbi:hypothetical protein RND81_03G228500 [Saponaria officinalis]|uniref:Uncharacterized protein n=1 Tax=Saponaria officinalis TaxID=3572 RepID=A0AAW1MAX2_SAPOF